MPDRDGFTTSIESQRLEKEADKLLKADAQERGFIRANGRGYSEYARSIGITTKKTLETTFKHEKLHHHGTPLEELGPVGGDPAAWVEMKEYLEEYAAAIGEHGMGSVMQPMDNTNEHKED